jgi:crotonobetainyl-CoA:carnitine CoA-transferase CaiB-like acyl-CoA transferase
MSSLQGVTVLDLTRLLPGPYCTMLLGDLGARVIKLEDTKTGDGAREMLPGIYYSVNRNKESIAVDLKQEEGREIVYRLAAGADVVVEGFRPGVADRLKVGYQDLKRANPGIIYCSISGFGQTGPYSLRPGHDINYLAISGAVSIPSSVGVPPTRPGLPVTDLCGGMFAAIAILAALMARRSGGPGQYLDVSMMDAIFSWVSTRSGEYAVTGEEIPPDKMKHLIPTNDIFETADGGEISIGVVEEHFWEAFRRVSDQDGQLKDEKFSTFNLRLEHAAELKPVLQELFRRRTLDEWSALLEEAGVPYAPVKSIAGAFNDPQLVFRRMVAEMYVPHLGKSIKQVAFPVQMTATPAEMVKPPPALGEHTDAVLSSFGFSGEEVKELRRKAVIK